MEFTVSFTAVIVAVVANFFLGFIWYTPLFGKAWGKEMGYDPNMKPQKSEMIKGMAFMVIGNFFFAWVLAHNMAAWKFVPDMAGMSPFAYAANTAFFHWLGFFMPVQLGATVWEKNSWKLFAINTGYHLASLLVVAAVLAYWK